MITHRIIHQSFRKQENSLYVKMHDWFSPPYSVNCWPSQRVLTPHRLCWLVISFSKMADQYRPKLTFWGKNPNESWPNRIQSKNVTKICPKWHFQLFCVEIQLIDNFDKNFSQFRAYIKGLKSLNSKYCSKSSRNLFKIINMKQTLACHVVSNSATTSTR